MRKIFIYRDPSSNLNFSEIKQFLELKLKNLKGIEVNLKTDLFSCFLKNNEKKIEEIAGKIAGARIFDIKEQRSSDSKPFYHETEIEKNFLKAQEKKVSGMLYDGLFLKNVCYELIPKNEKKLGFAHIIFLNRLFATFEENDRYHARAIILGFPSLISAQGIVEAPAKPKEYYLLKTSSPQMPLEVLKSRFEGRFLDYDDEKLTEAAKGYALQAIFYQFFREAFCENKNCRLYNAHYQEELINAQLKNGKQDICKKHANMLKIY